MSFDDLLRARVIERVEVTPEEIAGLFAVARRDIRTAQHLVSTDLECGYRMSSLTAKGTYLYFYCLGQKRHNGCQQKYVLAEDLEEAIEKYY